MQKVFKRAKITGSDPKRTKQYFVDLDKDIGNLFNYVNTFPKVYSQTTAPTIPNDTIALWHDTNNEKYYFIINIDAVQKQVELT